MPSDFNFLLYYIANIELVFFTYILFLICVCLYYKKHWNNVDFTNNMIEIAAFFVLLICCYIYNLTICGEGFCLQFCSCSIFFLYCKLFILVLTFFSLILSVDYFKNEKYALPEFPILVLFSALGMLFIIQTSDFFLFFLGLEIQSLIFYILAGLKRYSNLSIESSLKYFIYGSYSSCIMLFGISFIYFFFGTLNILEINNMIVDGNVQLNNMYLLIGIVLFISSLFFKIATFPFHFWIADVYEGSPIVVTAFFAIVPKFAIFIALIKLYVFLFYFFTPYLSTLYFCCGILSVLYGTIISLYQTKVKRLLAYGAISHVGFILVSISLGSVSGIVSSILYLVSYVVISFGIFSIVTAFREQKSTYKIRNLVEFSTMFRSSYFFAFVLFCSLLSAAGIPPFFGFFGKAYIFYSMLLQNYNF